MSVVQGAGVVTRTGTTLHGTRYNDTLVGTTGDDLLYGEGGNDSLIAGAGADTLVGGAGNDIYVVSDLNSLVVEAAGGGIDTVLSSVTFSLLDAAQVENLVLTGRAAANGTGNALANRITGNIAANELDGGAGADSMAGGLGDDTYHVDNAGDRVTELDGQGVDLVLSGVDFILGRYIENLTLLGTAARGTGNELANEITGNAVANLLDGATGADTMTGGDGNDTYVVDDAGDLTIEADAQGDADVVRASVSWTLAAHLENLVLTSGTAIRGIGNAGDNLIIGSTGANWLDGATGADTLQGGGGNDTYIVDSADDVVVEKAGEGVDVVRSGITLTLSANVEELVLTGGDAIDGTGNAASNRLTGNAAANVLDGGLGADVMRGGAGDDVYRVDNIKDEVTESLDAGRDRVEATVSFSLGANVEDLTLTGAQAVAGNGNEAGNLIIGSVAANRLDGRSGNDTLVGGEGRDVLVGGSGADVFRFATAADSHSAAAAQAVAYFEANLAQVAREADLVTDFSRVAGDRIDLSGLLDGAGGLQLDFIGNLGFTAPGQVRYEYSLRDKMGLLWVNTDAVFSTAELVVAIQGVPQIGANDLVL
jgi:Ca2+-binding RTX toxin-like protein